MTPFRTRLIARGLTQSQVEDVLRDLADEMRRAGALVLAAVHHAEALRIVDGLPEALEASGHPATDGAAAALRERRDG